MAKISGPIASAMRGKVGQVVAAKTVGGDTALRSYQPVVKNPNTLRQRAARQKFTDLSRLAAMLGYAVQIGYGKAVSGMKMYPRNLFLKTCAADAALYNDEEIDYAVIKVSRKMGLDVSPITPTVTYTEGTGITCRLGVTTPIASENGNKLGVIFVLYEPGLKDCRVLTGAVSVATVSGLVLPVGSFVAGGQYHVYAFLKEMLPTGTSITTETYPWKYPSNTGDTVYVGTVSAQ